MEAFGKYEVVEKIGEGGFGTVYLGLDPHLKRRVAIKTCELVTREEERQRFFREAEISARLQHPNITTVYEFGFEGDLPFFVQEYLTGSDLSVLIDEGTHLSLRRRVEILASVASGLAYAHQQGVVHRDVKPANIRVQDDGSVKLMDFGIARLTESETKLTKTGFSVGTAAYLAPEQIEGEIAGPQADVFAFGLVAYEFLTGQRAFKGPTVSALMYQILNTEPVAIQRLTPECPRRLEGVIRGCLAKDRTTRYPGFLEVCLDLEGVLATLPAEADLERSGNVLQTVASPRGDSETAPRLPLVREPIGEPVARDTTRIHPASHRVEEEKVTSTTVSTSPSSRRTLWWTGALVVALLGTIGLWLTRVGGEPVAIAVAPATNATSRPATADLASAPTSVVADPGAVIATEDPTVPSPLAAEPPSQVEPDLAEPVDVTEPESRLQSPGDDLAQLVAAARQRAAAARQDAVAAGADDQTLATADAVFRRAAEEGTTQAAAESYWESRAAFEAATTTPEPPSPSGDSAELRPSEPPVTAEPLDLAPSPPATDSAPSSNDAAQDQAEAQREAIASLLHRYRDAYEARSVEQLAALWPSIEPRRLANIERAFDQYRSLELKLSGCETRVDGSSATATCLVHQTAELAGGQSVENATETVFRLVLVAGDWVIDDL